MRAGAFLQLTVTGLVLSGKIVALRGNRSRTLDGKLAPELAPDEARQDRIR